VGREERTEGRFRVTLGVRRVVAVKGKGKKTGQEKTIDRGGGGGEESGGDETPGGGSPKAVLNYLQRTNPKSSTKGRWGGIEGLVERKGERGGFRKGGKNCKGNGRGGLHKDRGKSPLERLKKQKKQKFQREKVGTGSRTITRSIPRRFMHCNSGRTNRRKHQSEKPKRGERENAFAMGGKKSICVRAQEWGRGRGPLRGSGGEAKRV